MLTRSQARFSMQRRFYAEPSLHVEIYDAMTHSSWESDNTDVSFLCEEFRNIQGPILELACGTGRVAIALAQAGHELYGLDASPAMLAIASSKQQQLPAAIRGRLFLTEGNMRDFAFPMHFGGVFSTFRSFQHLLSPDDQESCLRCIHRHLRHDGILVLNLFDPRYDLLLPGESAAPKAPSIVMHPISGNKVLVEVLERTNDLVSQCITETWRFTEFGSDQLEVVRQEEEILRLRWTFRQEMRHLLRLCGFLALAEYSDFEKSPASYGKEQVWVAAKNG
jgi:SAM-dependent methyltransferase